jgi:hypothetical protein
MNSQTSTDSDNEGIAPACDSSQNNVSYTLLTSLPFGAYFACLKRVEPHSYKTYIRLWLIVHDAVPGVHHLPLINVEKMKFWLLFISG